MFRPMELPNATSWPALAHVGETQRLGRLLSGSAQPFEMCRPGAVSAAHLERQFVKPTLGQVGQLVADSQKSSWSRFVSAYAQQESHLQQAMERMTTPWLDAQKTMRSIAGFAELHGIGKAISNAKGFEDSLSAVLRRWSAPCTIRLTYRLCRQDCSLCDGVTNRRSYLSTKPGQLQAESDAVPVATRPRGQVAGLRNLPLRQNADHTPFRP